MLRFTQHALQLISIDVGNPSPELASVDLTFGVTGNLFEPSHDPVGVDVTSNLTDGFLNAAQQPVGMEVTFGTGDDILYARRHLIQFATVGVAHRSILPC